jgi:hypothetical protein
MQRLKDIENKEYSDLLRKDRQIKKETRAIFNYLFRKNIKTNKLNFGIDWNYLIETLKSHPLDINNYHIDHIIPLCYFKFVYIDGSLNLTEIQKAWSPANLRIIKKDKNIKKNICYSISNYPLRFEYIFNKDKTKEMYKYFRELKLKDNKDMENFTW